MGDTDVECEVDEELQRDVQSLREVLESESRTKPPPATGPSTDTTLKQLELCLKKNQELQISLYESLGKVDEALAENKKKRELLKNSGRECFRQTCTLFKFKKRKSYFTDGLGKHPQLCPDIVPPTKISNYYFYDNLWRPTHEDATLRRHVQIQAIEIASKPLQEELARATDEEEIKIIKMKMLELTNLGDDERLLRDVDPDEINWISVACEGFNSRKTPMDCRQRWVQVLAPSLNNSDWTKEEDRKLLKLGTEYGGRQWVKIAELMGSGRSVFSYFRRYQTTFALDSSRMLWSKELDTKLKEAVASYGSDNWMQVAKVVGRSVCQCRARWVFSINPKIKKGRWKVEEDRLLIAGIKEFGTRSWTKVALNVPNRTSTQCRERWVNVLDPNINNGEWTAEEDKKLIALCKQYEGTVISWAKVAQQLPTRTDSKCASRWKMLSSSDKVMKNFQYRKIKERINIKGKGATLAKARRKQSTLELHEFDDEMIPEELKKEAAEYAKRANKKWTRKSSGAPAGSVRTATYQQVAPVSAAGNMLTPDQTVVTTQGQTHQQMTPVSAAGNMPTPDQSVITTQGQTHQQTTPVSVAGNMPTPDQFSSSVVTTQSQTYQQMTPALDLSDMTLQELQQKWGAVPLAMNSDASVAHTSKPSSSNSEPPTSTTNPDSNRTKNSISSGSQSQPKRSCSESVSVAGSDMKSLLDTHFSASLNKLTQPSSSSSFSSSYRPFHQHSTPVTHHINYLHASNLLPPPALITSNGTSSHMTPMPRRSSRRLRCKHAGHTNNNSSSPSTVISSMSSSSTYPWNSPLISRYATTSLSQISSLPSQYVPHAYSCSSTEAQHLIQQGIPLIVATSRNDAYGSSSMPPYVHFLGGNYPHTMHGNYIMGNVTTSGSTLGNSVLFRGSTPLSYRPFAYSVTNSSSTSTKLSTSSSAFKLPISSTCPLTTQHAPSSSSVTTSNSSPTPPTQATNSSVPNVQISSSSLPASPKSCISTSPSASQLSSSIAPTVITQSSQSQVTQPSNIDNGDRLNSTSRSISQENSHHQKNPITSTSSLSSDHPIKIAIGALLDLNSLSLARNTSIHSLLSSSSVRGNLSQSPDLCRSPLRSGNVSLRPRENITSPAGNETLSQSPSKTSGNLSQSSPDESSPSFKDDNLRQSPLRRGGTPTQSSMETSTYSKESTHSSMETNTYSKESTTGIEEGLCSSLEQNQSDSAGGESMFPPGNAVIRLSSIAANDISEGLHGHSSTISQQSTFIDLTTSTPQDTSTGLATSTEQEDVSPDPSNVFQSLTKMKLARTAKSVLELQDVIEYDIEDRQCLIAEKAKPCNISEVVLVMYQSNPSFHPPPRQKRKRVSTTKRKHTSTTKRKRTSTTKRKKKPARQRYEDLSDSDSCTTRRKRKPARQRKTSEDSSDSSSSYTVLEEDDEFVPTSDKVLQGLYLRRSMRLENKKSCSK